jgi:hypothetical protein
MLFFFSYARADYSPYLKRFYADLTEAVRSKAGETTPRKIAFRDATSIEPGRPLPEEITESLRACKVFVYLHTPTFFTRDGCGREFRDIKNRVAGSSGPVAELAHASCIQPIYWDGEKQLANLPPEVGRIQLTHEDYGDDYNRWFISYNSQDVGLMQSLEQALRRKDPDAAIFFAPKSLRAGGLWLPEFARAIAEATAFVLLIGEKGVGEWQIMEYYEALDSRS